MSNQNVTTAARGAGFAESAVYGLSFAAALPVAIVAKASGWRWKPWPPSANGYQNVLREARLAAGMITTTVFSV
ncbi:MAG: hypothetical protein AAGH76_13190 [Pseudomonadota bacterium]